MSALVICGCGRKHGLADWTALPFVGYQDNGAGGRLELRNCHCGSTRTLQVEGAGLPWTIAGELAEVLRNDARDLEGLPSPFASPSKKRREPTDAELAEANRLHDVADVLMDRVAAWHARDSEAA